MWQTCMVDVVQWLVDVVIVVVVDPLPWERLAFALPIHDTSSTDESQRRFGCLTDIQLAHNTA